MISKNFLMISYLLHESDDLKALKIWACFAVFVVVATFIDLVFGIMKARHRKEEIESHKLRKTMFKLLTYLSLIFLCFLIDVILIYAWVDLPFVSMGVTIVILAIEIKSVYESADQKEKINIIGMSKTIVEFHEKGVVEKAKAIIDQEKKKNNDRAF